MKPNPLFIVRGIANYQFGVDIGSALFPDDCEFEFSRRTMQIRRISYHGVILATIRARDGRIVLTMQGAERLHEVAPYPRFRVVISSDVAPFIAEGRSAFAKHVLKVDPQLRAGDEALIVNDADTLLAVGKANLSPQEMLDLTRGIAVRVRHSIGSRDKSTSHTGGL